MPWLFEEEHLIRSAEIGKESWFVGLDVCKVLGIRDHKQALGRLDPDELGRYTVPPQIGDDQAREMIVISEAGVYRLVFTSRKPIAERFKRWLAHDVIPAIRKTGRYASATQVDDSSPAGVSRPFPDWPLEEMRTKGSTVDRYRMTYGISAARWVMPQLGFPPPPPDMIDPLPPRQHSFDYPAGPPGGH